VRVLAFDSSSSTASAVFATADSVLAARRAEVKRHGTALQPLLEEVLREAGASLDDVELIAVGLGPGSFTGTRIGVAVAKGLAFGRGLPLVGVGSLEVLAAGFPGEGLRAPLVDAGRGRVYGGVFATDGGGVALRGALFDQTPEAALTQLAEQGPVTVLGSGVARYEALAAHDARTAGDETPDAAVLARLAIHRAAAGRLAEPTLEPIYVRASDAKLPARAQAVSDS